MSERVARAIYAYVIRVPAWDDASDHDREMWLRATEYGLKLIQNIGWQRIDTAPRNGTEILCWAPGWERSGCLLVWKTNNRIGDAHKRNELPELLESYFGDPDESDDYALAKIGNGPTHWYPTLPPPM